MRRKIAQGQKNQRGNSGQKKNWVNHFPFLKHKFSQRGIGRFVVLLKISEFLIVILITFIGTLI